MGRTHLAITVELVHGSHTGDLWPRPGRVLIASRSATFEQLGVVSDRPLPCWGWGDIPDQYGRRWSGDDGSTPMPPAPDGMSDLPPILPWWGPRPSRARQATPASREVTEIRYRDLIT